MAQDDTIDGGEAEDTLATGVSNAALEVAAEAPLVSRDERRDSIDPATGLLTDEAIAIRRAEREAAGE